MIVKVLVNLFNYNHNKEPITIDQPRKGYGMCMRNSNLDSNLGIIYTAYHVIQDAPNAYIIYKKLRFKAQVLASYIDDLAVLKMPEELLKIFLVYQNKKEEIKEKVKEKKARGCSCVGFLSSKSKNLEDLEDLREDSFYLKNTEYEVLLSQIDKKIFLNTSKLVLKQGDSGSPIFLKKRFHTITSSISSNKVYACSMLKVLRIKKIKN